MSFTGEYLNQAKSIIEQLRRPNIDALIDILAELRAKSGRLFVIGSGGGAGHASHACCDFRKLCNIEAYCPTDNVSEITARTNDEGWESAIRGMLCTSRICSRDCVFVFSVGGGDEARKISGNLVEALKLAKSVGAKIVGIVGRDGGFTAKVADACVIIPTISPELVTPQTESFQALLWHLMVSHPKLQFNKTVW